MDEHRSPRTRWAFLGFVAIAAFFLFTEHRAHVYQFLPFVLLLACPLMHLFMHHGHGHGHARHHAKPGGERPGDRTDARPIVDTRRVSFRDRVTCAKPPVHTK